MPSEKFKRKKKKFNKKEANRRSYIKKNINKIVDQF